MQLLDGKQTSERIKSEIAAQVGKMAAAGEPPPHLAAVLVGSDGASETYVRNKVLACEKVGFRSTLVRLNADVSQQALLDQVEALNRDPDIDGYIVQLPLPGHIDETAVTLAVDPDKDVDGFHPTNLGRMCLGLPTFIPATPNGIMELLARHDIETEGRHCVVVGRSHIVGTPMSILMSRNSRPGNCTVTTVHSRTRNMADICRSADILVVAIGKAGFVGADMVKPGAVVIDVGITRVADDSRSSGFRLRGDVDFEAVAGHVGWITPVPGGVGPMTIASLLQNTLKARTPRNDG